MAELPHAGTVTAIEPQKRRKNRVSVHIDGEFAFGIDREVAEQWDIRVERYLQQDEIERILGEDEFKRALERAYRFLAARARSRSELQKRLQEYRYPPFVIDKVLQKCEALGYIDDRTFALQYARSRLLNRPLGKQLLRRELQQRGISEPLIDSAVEQAYAKRDEATLAEELASKRLGRLKGLPVAKARQRMAAFLRSRGFQWEIIQEILQNYFNRQDGDFFAE